jgi:hypothetical protein
MKVLTLAVAVTTILATGAEASARHHHRSHVRHHHHYRYAAYAHESHHASGTGVLSAVIPALAAKAAEITSACGSHIISGFRPHAVVAGTNRTSLHASGHAVDIQGNPSCIFSHLKNFSGGYSIDYNAVHHVHISLGGREDGKRFVHGGGRHRWYHRWA